MRPVFRYALAAFLAAALLAAAGCGVPVSAALSPKEPGRVSASAASSATPRVGDVPSSLKETTKAAGDDCCSDEATKGCDCCDR
jgi:hypothetical protein